MTLTVFYKSVFEMLGTCLLCVLWSLAAVYSLCSVALKSRGSVIPPDHVHITLACGEGTVCVLTPRALGVGVDACGVCGGDGVVVDVSGVCCSWPLSPSGVCCEGMLDSCGVCGGTNDCDAVVTVSLPSSANASSVAGALGLSAGSVVNYTVVSHTSATVSRLGAAR